MVIAEHPDLFSGWIEADFDELFSRVGTGGGLTAEGALEAVRAMNRKRLVHEKVDLLLENSEAELFCGIVDLLYRKVTSEGK